MHKPNIPDVPLYHKGSREEEAELTLKRTTVSRPVAMTIILIFLAVIFAESVFQHVVEIYKNSVARHNERQQTGRITTRLAPKIYQIGSLFPSMERIRHVRGLRDAWNLLPPANKIKEFETALENDSVSAQFILPRAQDILVRLGAGNEKTYCGRDRWLFYRPEIDFLTGPGFLEPGALRKREQSGSEKIQPDPRQAILQFRDQLAERGIALIVMPLPCKPAIHPEQFSESCGGLDYPLQNPSCATFKQELATNGVLVFDCAPLLIKHKLATGKPQYLATDTHWQPETMEFVAAALKAFIQTHVKLMERPPSIYQRGQQTVFNLGDLALMLKLLPAQTYYAQQTVAIRPVLTHARNPWQPDATSDVLVLGDSFCNIYSLDTMGWGESAGLIEQLSFELQRPLDRLVINDNGAYATRALLARELARGRDRLAGKKLVIWEFAERELAAGDWKSIPLALGQPAPTHFMVPAPGKDFNVRGIVQASAPVPRPGTVPYNDHIVAVHVADLECDQQAINGNQALVYLQSMRSNVWTPAARLRPGDTVNLRLRSWSDVAPRYERINRTELADETTQLAEPCWGELTPANE